MTASMVTKVTEPEVADSTLSFHFLTSVVHATTSKFISFLSLKPPPPSTEEILIRVANTLSVMTLSLPLQPRNLLFDSENNKLVQRGATSRVVPLKAPPANSPSANVAGKTATPLPNLRRPTGQQDPPTDGITSTQLIGYVREHRLTEIPPSDLTEESSLTPATMLMRARTGLRVLVCCPTLAATSGGYTQSVQDLFQTLTRSSTTSGTKSSKSNKAAFFGLQMLLNTLVTCDNGSVALGDPLNVDTPLDCATNLLWHQGRTSFLQAFILPYISRIRSLTNILLTREDITAFVKVRGTDTSELTTIDITSIDNFDRSLFKGYRVITTGKYCILAGLPELNALPDEAMYLRIQNVSRVLDDTHIPWSQVTHVNLNNCRFKFHHLLAHLLRPMASTLTSGEFNVSFDRLKYHRRFLPRLGRPVEMVSLLYLSLNLDDPSQHKGFLSYIRLPAIVSLEIASLDRYEPLVWDIEALSALLSPASSIYSYEPVSENNVNKTLTSLRLIDKHPKNCVPTLNAFRSKHPGCSRLDSLPCVSATLSGLLSYLPSLTVLALPTLLPLHPHTLCLIGVGALLQNLTTLVATSPWVDPVCAMIDTRNAAVGPSTVSCSPFEDVDIITFSKAKMTPREWQQWGEELESEITFKIQCEYDRRNGVSWSLTEGRVEDMVAARIEAESLAKRTGVNLVLYQFMEHPVPGLGVHTEVNRPMCKT